jgi:hypothetical protein
MEPSVIVRDLETVPDLSGFAAANDLVGRSDVAVSTSRLSCKRAGKTRTLMPVWDSSGEYRLSAFTLVFDAPTPHRIRDA